MPSMLARRVDPYLIVILIIPVLVLFRDTNIAFTAPGFIDPWIYLGFFHNLVLYKGSLFPNTYYGSRLSWVLPGYVVNKLFSPLAANYILHLGVFYVATASLFLTLRRTVDRRAALLAAIAFGFYSSLWVAVGWDYVDGVGIAYYLLTTAILTYAADLEDQRVGLVLAGASCAALIYSNATWLMYSPFFPAYYFVLSRSNRHTSLAMMLARFVTWFGTGVLLVTVPLCVINHKIAGYYWFYYPSLSYGGSALLKPNPWRAPDLSWVKGAKWLVLPGMTFLVCAAAALSARSKLFSKRHAASTAFLGNFLFMVGVLVWLEIRASSFLQFFYYASYLIPLAFLVLGSWTFRGTAGLTRKSFWVLVLAALLLLAIPWWDVSGGLSRMLAKTEPAWLLCIVCGGMLAATLFPGRRVILVILLVGFSAFNSYLGTVGAAPPSARRDSYMRIVQGLQSIEKVRTPGRGVWFWFDVYEPYGREFDSLNSAWLWGYTWLGREFPTPLRNDLKLSAGELIVVPSSRGGVLGRAQKAFWRKDLGLRLQAETQIHYGSGGYSISFLEVTANPGNVRPLALSLNRKTRLWRWSPPGNGKTDPVLPLEMWTNEDRPDSTSRLEHLPQGLRVTAGTDEKKYVVIYGPLQAPADGNYLFSLKLRQLSGSMKFGVLDGDKNRWLIDLPLTRVEGGNEYQDCSMHLTEGQPFWLAATAAPPPAAPANFVIEELKAYRYKE